MITTSTPRHLRIFTHNNQPSTPVRKPASVYWGWKHKDYLLLVLRLPPATFATSWSYLVNLIEYLGMLKYCFVCLRLNNILGTATGWPCSVFNQLSNNKFLSADRSVSYQEDSSDWHCGKSTLDGWVSHKKETNAMNFPFSRTRSYIWSHFSKALE